MNTLYISNKFITLNVFSQKSKQNKQSKKISKVVSQCKFIAGTLLTLIMARFLTLCVKNVILC